MLRERGKLLREIDYFGGHAGLVHRLGSRVGQLEPTASDRGSVRLRQKPGIHDRRAPLGTGDKAPAIALSHGLPPSDVHATAGCWRDVDASPRYAALKAAIDAAAAMAMKPGLDPFSALTVPSRRGTRGVRSGPAEACTR